MEPYPPPRSLAGPKGEFAPNNRYGNEAESRESNWNEGQPVAAPLKNHAADFSSSDDEVNNGATVLDLRNGLTPAQQQQLLQLLTLYHQSSSDRRHKLREKRRRGRGAHGKKKIEESETCSEENGGALQVVPPVVALQSPRELADPAPVALLAFGMTTILLNFCNAGIVELNLAVVGMALAYGGSVQLIAGILEFVRGNTFGCTVSMTYGAFWIATVAQWMLPTDPSGHQLLLPEPSRGFASIFMTVWSIFALVMFLCSFRLPVMASFLFLTTLVTFTLQAISHYLRSDTVMKVSGYAGIICGATAMYVGFAFQLMNCYGREILPLLPREQVLASIKKRRGGSQAQATEGTAATS